MGHRKARKRKPSDGTQNIADPTTQPSSDPARALLALQPNGSLAALACGNNVKVCDTRTGAPADVLEATHGLPIRALCFSACGRLLASAGDDKSVIVRAAAKKVSALAFAADGRHIFFADKFGDVLAAAVPPKGSAGEEATFEAAGRPHLLLGHFSSVVTCLLPSAGGRWLVSADREGKARVSKLPQDPLKGAHCIQSFCLGHAAFVTCAAFVESGAQLVTGSGDGTIKLWDPATGLMLDSFDTAPYASHRATLGADEHGLQQPEPDHHGNQNDIEEAGPDDGMSRGMLPAAAADAAAAEAALGGTGEVESDAEDDGRRFFERRLEDLPPAVLSVAASANGQLLAAAIEGESDSLLLSCRDSELGFVSRQALPGVTLPVSLAFRGSDILWGAGGCEQLLPLTIGAARVDEQAHTGEPRLAELRACLGAAPEGPAATLGVSEQTRRDGLQVSPELRKWFHSEEELTSRKKGRADLRAAPTRPRS